MKKVKIQEIEYDVIRILKHTSCGYNPCDKPIYVGENVIADKNGTAYHFDCDSKDGKRCGSGVEGYETCIEDCWWDEETEDEFWYFVQIQGNTIQIDDDGKILPENESYGTLETEEGTNWIIKPINEDGYYVDDKKGVA